MPAVIKAADEHTKIADDFPLRSHVFGHQSFIDREPVAAGSLPPSLGSPSTRDFEERSGRILIR